MENQSRIEELWAEMLIKQDVFVDELRNVRTEVVNVKTEVINVKIEVASLKEKVTNVEFAIGKVESEIAKRNLQTASNTRAIMALSDEIGSVIDHENRITKLETIVIK